ncbi:MAG: AAA family ATPase [Clostridia bacterium]|nr:AAA family ATPase [Clostridia bacterium]
MKRMMIIGSPGSGKSTLAKLIAQKEGLPLVHLDKLFWQEGWVETPAEEFDRRLAEAVDKDAWVIDGNYTRTISMRLKRADMVVFLDYPRRICMWRICKRILKHYGRTRSDMGSGCPERFDVSFLQYVWNFRKHSREKILALLTDAKGKQIVHIQNKKEYRHFVKGL